ncbi:hypothetical protein E8E14_008557 [Neopestalotiopsis sp. 37M]|nr:hypothetical protein E8E14_008557 [Neopestalotiopsis sp. 37M]
MAKRDGKGKLVIADFGLAKFHLLDTQRRKKNSSMFDRTLRYEPPEMEIENLHPEDKNPRSRNYDVWSMGCIFLEFSIWLVYGWNYLESFIEANANEMFWKLENGVHLVHPAVQREISKMMEELKVDVAVRDIIKLVRDRLLVVTPVNSKSSQGVSRATVQELLDSMKRIMQRASEEELYLQAPVVPQRTTMGDLLAVRQKASVPRTSQRILSPPTDEAGPKILVRAATGDLSENDQANQPSLHPQTVRQTTELNHNWESTPDNTFAIQLFQQVDCSTLKPSSKVSKLCPTCESLNFEETPFEFKYDLALMKRMSEFCELCKLLRLSLSNVGLPGSTMNQRLRLVETVPGCQERYIALSHCWGNIQETETVRAKKSNVAELKRRIDYKLLPKTFRDAVRCAWELGIRYLWIDSICIIQDDEEDWGAESQKMESVFSSAYCTIAASSAKSSVDGMFQVHREPRTCVTLKSRNSGNLYLCGVIDNFQRDVEESVLNTRGWVFQERALSRRTIHYTSNQVYWECGHGVRCETLGKLRNSMAAFMGDSDFPTSALRYFKGGRILLLQRLYEMYSKRAFTKPTDRSVALLGLEKRLARTFQTKAQYGIVEEYMERGLLIRHVDADNTR